MLLVIVIKRSNGCSLILRSWVTAGSVFDREPHDFVGV
jgi:hypothetical protein